MQTKILDLFKLDGQVALVVGGNRGLGLTMAKTLAEAGAGISIAARDQSANEAAAAEIKNDYKSDVISISCDVTNEESVREAVQKPLAILVRSISSSIPPASTYAALSSNCRWKISTACSR